MLYEVLYGAHTVIEGVAFATIFPTGHYPTETAEVRCHCLQFSLQRARGASLR
jgi:hypothetical protein